MKPWEDIFGKTPASFADSVQRTLAGLEEKPMTNHSYNRHTRRRTARTVALIAAAAALLGSAAFAAGVLHGDFYNSFFGSAAVSGDTVVEAHDASYYDAEKDTLIEFTMPGYELVQVDEEQAEALLGDYMQGTGESVTAGDYTMTLESFVKDENGIYLVCYSLENPGGWDGLNLGDYNGYSFINGYPDDFPFTISDGKLVYVDEKRTTDTKLCLCYAAVDISTAHALAGVKASLSVYENFDSVTFPDEPTLIKEFSLDTDTLTPVITAQADGMSAYLSPIGLRIEGAYKTDPNYPEMRMGFECRDVRITMKDGSEYTVIGDGVDNTHYVLGGGDIAPDCTLCFNRLIDPAQVDSITADGTVIRF